MSKRHDEPTVETETETHGMTHDEIAKRAYEAYERSGCLPGRCSANWAEAEKELGGEKYVGSETMPS